MSQCFQASHYNDITLHYEILHHVWAVDNLGEDSCPRTWFPIEIHSQLAMPCLQECNPLFLLAKGIRRPEPPDGHRNHQRQSQHNPEASQHDLTPVSFWSYSLFNDTGKPKWKAPLGVPNLEWPTRLNFGSTEGPQHQHGQSTHQRQNPTHYDGNPQGGQVP